MNVRPDILDKRRRIREAIRQAAIDEFAVNGLAGASTHAIAQRAGLSKPQLHYYISSKEDLYEEVLLSIVDEWRDIFFFSSVEEDPARVIREYVRKKIGFSRRHPNMSRVFSSEVARGAPVLLRHWDKSREATREAARLIQSWIDKGLIRALDPMLFQMHIWAVTQHYADYDAQIRFMLDLPEDAEIDEAHVVEEVTRLFLRACGLE